jgi:hypothetical protein
MTSQSDKIKLMEQGPFPTHIDPWAEKGRYFHQLHPHIIGYLLDQISDGLYMRGYVVGRETSVQITTSQPDLFIETEQAHPPKSQKYGMAAATLELEAGVELVQPEIELDRLFIQALDTGTLVTVVELISPNNKTKQKDMLTYQSRRESLIQQGVNVVEIDFTRSVKRLLDDPITEKYPYHIVVYPIGEAPYFLGMQLTDAPKTFALPLRDEVYPAELNSLYRQAYARLHIAAQIQKTGDYTLEALPFPSLFTDDERQQLLATLQAWQDAVKAV